MDRRSFLSLAVACSSTLVLGANQEVIPSAVTTKNSSLMVKNLLDKLNTVQNHVGYVRFNTISFDEMLKMAVHCNKPLTPYEVGYIETIFYGDPRRYGFYGERTVPRLTAITPKKDLIYIKQSGHFLLRGAATEKYTTIKKLIGNELILTSGVRAPVKQLHLFLKKIVSEGGDLRLASTSIAPPGFTFHSVGDFDIGKVGYGHGNFSTKFQETDVFKKLYDGGEKNSITLGRMKLDTPFVNPQDGRMIPTFEQGVWVTSAFSKEWSGQAGYINAFWNRNTPEWKSVEDSLGYGYEMGNSSLETTVAGNYRGNTSSDGLFIANIRYGIPHEFTIDVWDYYLENIFNLSYADVSYTFPYGPVELSYGAQYIYQRQSGDGGNSEDNSVPTDAIKAKSYMQEGEKSTTYGVKTAIKYRSSKLTFAYNQTTDDGRFLFPREWGKEPLYTFQKRERSDGSGNSHAWLTSVEHNFAAQGLSGLDVMAGYGEYKKTDAKEWKYNKYGHPSYAQWNIDVFYRFGGRLKGLRAEYLLARKVARGETYQIPGASEYNFIFRKNGITQQNFILNYDF